MHTVPLTANATILTYTEVFSVSQVAGGVAVQDELGLQFWSPNGFNNAIMCNRGGASDWETFKILPQDGGYVAISANRNSMYLSVQGDTTVAPTAKTIGDNELFLRISPDGGNFV